MTNAVQTQIQIKGRRGNLNCLLFEPDNPADDCNFSKETFKEAVLFLPGMPGTDQNEDIAEELCRNHFRVLCLSYSGSCGSDGSYSLAHMLQDSETAFLFLQEKERRPLFILGHSLGGFVCAQLAARHAQEIRAAVMMFPCDIGRLPIWEKEAFMTSEIVKDFFYTHTSSLYGTTSDVLLDEIFRNADIYSLVHLAPALSGMPLYMIGGSRDHYAPPSLNCRPLIDAVHAAGGGRILYREFPAGHYGDESRNGISRSILEFFTKNK